MEVAELVWTYTPSDYFEAEATFHLDCGVLTSGAGEARLRLVDSVNPLLPEARSAAASAVDAVFAAHCLTVHRDYQLNGPNLIRSRDSGARDITMFVVGVEAKVSLGRVDFRITDAGGNIVEDTKGARLELQRDFVNRLAPKTSRSHVLRKLLASYMAAVRDQANELVHLFEIRDALQAHFKGAQRAQQALRLSKSEWEVLGRVANDGDLVEGRHRGLALGSPRQATEAELARARASALLLIDRFAETVV